MSQFIPVHWGSLVADRVGAIVRAAVDVVGGVELLVERRLMDPGPPHLAVKVLALAPAERPSVPRRTPRAPRAGGRAQQRNGGPAR